MSGPDTAPARAADDRVMSVVDAGTILRVEVGSGLYGTAIDGTDDRDEMAVFIEPPHVALGLNRLETVVRRTQPEGVRSGPGDLDLVCHSLRKFVRLAAGGNPSILVALWAPSTAYSVLEPIGVNLIGIREWFSTHRALDAFAGYMQAQRERLEGSRGQKSVKRPELIERYGYDTKYAGHVLRLGYQGARLCRTGGLDPLLTEAERQSVVNVRTGVTTLAEMLDTAGALETIIRERPRSMRASPPTADIDAWLASAHLGHWRAAPAPATTLAAIRAERVLPVQPSAYARGMFGVVTCAAPPASGESQR